MSLLPFYQVGRFKWKTLGLEYTLGKVEPPGAAALGRACALIRDSGLAAY